MTSPEAGSDIMFVIFQGMFAIITPALITGAFVERFKFSTYLVFITIWVSLFMLQYVIGFGVVDG